MNRRVVGYREGDFPVRERVANPRRCICPETVADQNDRLVRGQLADAIYNGVGAFEPVVRGNRHPSNLR
jgi:hypothetical protein